MPSGLTISQMKLRIAERASILAEVGGLRTVPVDVGNADRIARALQDGIDELCDRRLWSWMRATLEIALSSDGTSADCVGGSPVRYKMPDGVSTVPHITEIPVLEDGVNYGHGAALISTVQMERMRANDQTSVGTPRFASFGQGTVISATGSTPLGADNRPIMQMQVWPKPDKTYTLRFPVYRRPSNIVADDGPIPWPSSHDHTVIAFATLALLRVDRPADSAALVNAQTEAERRYAISERIDMEIDAEPIPLSNPSTPPFWRRAIGYDYDGTPIT